MSKKFSASMFDELKNAMAEQRSGANFKDILKTDIGKNYIVRLIPNVNDISKTIYHYFSHGWKSLATGQFVSCVCPTTFGERCPICEERVRLYRGDDEDKANARLLGRKEQWLVNAYVVDDPNNRAENNGTVKIIRYGKQLDKIIRDATEGVDKDDFGARVFDLTEEGCNLRISVEKNDGGFATYVSSKFLRESAIDGMNDSKIESIYEKLLQLEKVFERKSPDEVKEILDTHFFCSNTSEPINESKLQGVEVTAPEVDEIDESESTSTSGSDEESTDSVQDKLDALMKDL